MKKTTVEKRQAREKRDVALICKLVYIKNYSDGVVAYYLQKEKKWTLGRVIIAMLDAGWSLEKTCRACRDAGNELSRIIKVYWNNKFKKGHPTISDLFSFLVKGGIADRTILRYCKNAGMKAYYVSSLCLQSGWSQERASTAFLQAGWEYEQTGEQEISLLDE